VFLSARPVNQYNPTATTNNKTDTESRPPLIWWVAGGGSVVAVDALVIGTLEDASEVWAKGTPPLVLSSWLPLTTGWIEEGVPPLTLLALLGACKSGLLALWAPVLVVVVKVESLAIDPLYPNSWYDYSYICTSLL